MTFLIHPEHGATNAPESEVEELKKQGWHVSNHAYWLSLKGKPFVAPKDACDTGGGGKTAEPPKAPAAESAGEPAPKRKGGRPPKAPAA